MHEGGAGVGGCMRVGLGWVHGGGFIRVGA